MNMRNDKNSHRLETSWPDCPPMIEKEMSVSVVSDGSETMAVENWSFKIQVRVRFDLSCPFQRLSPIELIIWDSDGVCYCNILHCTPNTPTPSTGRIKVIARGGKAGLDAILKVDYDANSIFFAEEENPDGSKKGSFIVSPTTIKGNNFELTNLRLCNLLPGSLPYPPQFKPLDWPEKSLKISNKVKVYNVTMDPDRTPFETFKAFSISSQLTVTGPDIKGGEPQIFDKNGEPVPLVPSKIPNRWKIEEQSLPRGYHSAGLVGIIKLDNGCMFFEEGKLIVPQKQTETDGERSDIPIKDWVICDGWKTNPNSTH